MAAPSLQRSAETFRRSGSSGLVWEDRFLSEEVSLAKNKAEGASDFRELREGAAGGQMERSRSKGGARPYRTGRVSPVADPPSPKVSACGFCGVFGNSGKTAKKPKPRRR